MAQRGTAASINLGELEKLAALQCTNEEIAAWFGVSTRTIERRRKSKIFAEAMDRGKAKGRISLRRAQLRMVDNNNATMGIWLGKQYLGQSDEFGLNQGPLLVVAYGGQMSSAAPPQIPPAGEDSPALVIGPEESK